MGIWTSNTFSRAVPVAKVAGVKHSRSANGRRVCACNARNLINQLQLYQQYAQYFGMDLSPQEQQIVNAVERPDTMGQTVLDQMIDEELIRQEAAKRGIAASTKEVDEAIQASFQYYPNGTPTPSVTPTPS